MKGMTGKELLIKLRSLAESELFLKSHRMSESDFTRERKLNFMTMIFSILKLLKKSLQIECELLESDPKVLSASKQAFSKSRYKVQHSGFVELFEATVKSYYQGNNCGLWHRYRLIACDGSKIRLAISKETVTRYGRYKTNQYDGKEPLLGHVSVFLDLSTSMILSAVLESSKAGERAMALSQLPNVTSKMRELGNKKLLYIYDRGYVSMSFIKDHIELGVDYIVRICSKQYKGVWSKVNRGEKDFVIEMEGDKHRVVVIPLQREEEVLITSLANDITVEDLYRLYGLRWRIEESYKRLKVAAELENFSGNKLEAVLQDFWAHMVISNILTVFIREKEEPWNPDKIPSYILNFSVLLGATREQLRSALFGKMSIENFSALFDRVALRAKVKVRTGRAFSRDGVNIPKRKHIFRRSC